MKRFILFLLAICLMLPFACAAAENKPGVQLPVVGMGYNDQFWQTVYDGVNAAAKDENINVDRKSVV